MNEIILRRSTSADFELRKAADNTIGLSGYAAVFDVEAHRELVTATAFDKTLKEKADVRLLVNHDGVPLARTKSGTMKLSTDAKGLVVNVDNLDPSNPTVAELISAMDRGDLDQMSFAFTPVRMNDITDPDSGEYLRTELVEVRLWDVSIVTYPWYDTTSVELNELDRALVALRSGNLTPELRSVILDRARDTADAGDAAADKISGVAAERERFLELVRRAR
jgi:HK97 family phage prohead protease